MKERLIVYLKGERIGFIEFDHDANTREFSYDGEYLSRVAASPISLLLPLQCEPFDSWRTRLFFENLLPPDVVRRKLEKIIHHDHDNYFAHRCDISPKAVLSRLDALAEILPERAAEIAERMSDEGVPSPIYGKIRAVIERHVAQIRCGF